MIAEIQTVFDEQRGRNVVVQFGSKDFERGAVEISLIRFPDVPIRSREDMAELIRQQAWALRELSDALLSNLSATEPT